MKIYIDGENFRKGLENVLIKSGALKKGESMRKYDVKGLLTDVMGTNRLDITYYASRVKLPRGYEPTQKIKKLADDIKTESRVWIANLASQGIEIIKAGNLKIKQSKPCAGCKKTQEILQEKGVDVRLAVDLLEDVYEKKLSPVGLVSSDTDLCPVLHKARDKRVKVTYICFSESVNRAVAAVANETITIPTKKAKEYLGV